MALPSSASRSVVDAMERPRIIQLRPNLYAAAFGLMKLLPARYMLDRAEERGEVDRGTTVLETSSGTFGLGLAMVCRLRGYNLGLVGDPAIDTALRRRLRQLGARLEICEKPSSRGGYQRARLDRLEALREQYPRHWIPGQYGNPDNPVSYATVAEQLAETIGAPDCLVGAVGSGGSTGGTGSFLRLVAPELWVIGVDTPRSTIFGQPDGPRLVRGLGNSLIPPNVNHEIYDEVHWVGAGPTFRATRHLHGSHALYMGPTSGAAFLVADRWAQENPDGTAVVLLPDEGHRYQDTVYADEWLHEHGIDLGPVPPVEPRELTDATAECGDWAWMRWDRRRLGEPTGRLAAV